MSQQPDRGPLARAVARASVAVAMLWSVALALFLAALVVWAVLEAVDVAPPDLDARLGAVTLVVCLVLGAVQLIVRVLTRLAGGR